MQPDRIVEELRQSPSGGFWRKDNWVGTEILHRGSVGKVTEDKKVRVLTIDYGKGGKKKIELPYEGYDPEYLKQYSFRFSENFEWMKFFRKGRDGDIERKSNRKGGRKNGRKNKK